jgi:myo-inositol-1-phosphate synthase
MQRFNNESFTVVSDNVKYNEEEIVADYNYLSTKVVGNCVYPLEKKFTFKTIRRVPKLGVMLVGWGGNNGTTITAGIIANSKHIDWNTKEGVHKPDYFGSVTQSSAVRLGLNEFGESVNIPFKNLLPMIEPNDIVLGGWDISSLNLADSMIRAKVLEYDLQKKLIPLMKDLKPLPSIYSPSFIAANQSDRADNVIVGTKEQQLEVIRANIREFKLNNSLDKVIVLWTANTERFCEVEVGLNDTAATLLASIKVFCFFFK